MDIGSAFVTGVLSRANEIQNLCEWLESQEHNLNYIQTEEQTTLYMF